MNPKKKNPHSTILFLLWSVYDTLSSLSHLHTWGLRGYPLCKLCGQRGTLAHILSGCKTALSQGRYSWRHNKVLLSLADTLEQERCKKRPVCTSIKRPIPFIKEGARPFTIKKTKTSQLHTTSSWEMAVDVGRRLKFPEVVHTTLRPDLVLWSTKDQKMILVELMVPWEEGCKEAHERRPSSTSPWSRTAGTRAGKYGQAHARQHVLGLNGSNRKQAACRIGEEAERAFCWLWSKREEESWRPGTDGQ